MSDDLDTLNAPFSLLTDVERIRAGSSMDIGYFNPGDTLIEPGEAPGFFYVIIKGLVEESDPAGEGVARTVIAQYRDGDHFGSLANLSGRSRHRYSATEETLVRMMPRQVFIDLAHGNTRFGEYFHRNLATRSKLVASSSAHRDMVGFSLARIDARSTREAVVVSAGTSVRQAIRIMRNAASNCLLVERDAGHGMVTRTDLLDAVADDDAAALDRDVATIATFDLATVDVNAYLFEALVAMTRRHIERVVVMDGHRLDGVVELSDVLGFLSSHSHVVGLRIATAADRRELGLAATGVVDLVHSLFAQRVHIRFIMDLLAALNRRIIARLFELTVPAQIAGRVCLLITGSEGRGEQVMRTDQNNAMVLSDNFAWPQRDALLTAFTQDMLALGYPASEHGIVVSNPSWAMAAHAWAGRFDDWIAARDAEGILALSAMLDATPVAGDRSLYDTLAKRLDDNLPRDADFIGAFLSPLRTDVQPPALFDKATGKAATIDIKTNGIFPLVHGVRALALEHRIAAANTYDRIDSLVDDGALDPAKGADLGEALSVFMQMRLRQQLDRHELAAGTGVDPRDANNIEIDRLSRPELDLMRGALNVVHYFRASLLQRFTA